MIREIGGYINGFEKLQQAQCWSACKPMTWRLKVDFSHACTLCSAES